MKGQIISQISGLCPIFFCSIEKRLELLYPSEVSLPHNGVPIDFKVGTTGVHINIELDEKQIQIFE